MNQNDLTVRLAVQCADAFLRLAHGNDGQTPLDDDAFAQYLAAQGVTDDASATRSLQLLALAGASLAAAEIRRAYGCGCVTGPDANRVWAFDLHLMPGDRDPHTVAALRLVSSALNSDPALGHDVLVVHTRQHGVDGLVTVIVQLVTLYLNTRSAPDVITRMRRS